jgi:Ca2+:H+ antiporter
MKISQLGWSPLDALLVCLPLGLILKLTGASPGWVFACSCLAIIPLAGWMGRATEHLAAHLGPGAGGLINATFGNAAELIIAVLALKEGLHGVVKASLTGSIIGNILLVLGLSMLVGGFRHRRQKFNRTAAGLGSTLLAVSAEGLMVPAIVHAVGGRAIDEDLQRMSLIIAVVLFVT